MEHIILSLGSNVGDRHAHLDDARQHLEDAGVKILKTSQIYESEPVGYSNQDDFLNQVLIVETTQSPQELLETCLAVERKMGRVRVQKNGPRLIDIDILFYQDKILSEDSLLLPHPRIAERRFILVPLTELAAEQVHPVLEESIQELLQTCPEEHWVERSA